MKRTIRAALLAVMAMLSGLAGAGAGDLRALARVESVTAEVVDGGLDLTLGLTTAVPWRVFTLADPYRVVMDFREVDWRGADMAPLRDVGAVRDLRYGTFRPGWSRVVADLAAPLVIDEALLKTDRPRPVLSLSLRPADPATHAARSGAPDGALWPQAAGQRRGEGALVIAIDPGHGGIDPGATRAGVSEKDLVLAFSLRLAEVLEADPAFSVFLTRTEDIYVGLSDRIRLSQEAGADVMLSIHVNTVEEGNATGATVYTLSETASDESAARFAELENRADISAGLALAAEDDAIARILIDLSAAETRVRTKHLSDAVYGVLRQNVRMLRTRPQRSADLKVLKSPDIPSLLLELGFLSSATDRANIADPGWQTLAAESLRAALHDWAAGDAALSQRMLR